MTGAPERILLFHRVRCRGPDWDVTFPRPEEEGSAEEQCDRFLLGRQLQGRAWAWAVRFEVEADQGVRLDVQATLQRRRHKAMRQAIAEALAADGQARLAERVLGHALRPAAHGRKAATHAVQDVRLPAAERARPTGYCPCGKKRLPRMRAYQEGRAVAVLALHAVPRTGRLCMRTARLWLALDPREASPVTQPAGPLPPLRARRAWLAAHLAAVPAELGGPLGHLLPSLLDGPG